MFSQKFIKATDNYCTYEKNVHAPYIRKTFELSRAVEKADITLTCTGFYRFFVNGKELTASRLAPTISNPDDILFYDTYDVAEYLTEGTNVFGFILGNGFSNCMGGFIWDFQKALFRSSPKLALSFESDEVSFEADGTFKTCPSPIYFDDIRSGEFYNAEYEIADWNLATFDDSSWSFVIETETPRGQLLANDTDKVVVRKELTATEIVKGSNGQTPNDISQQSHAYSKTAFYKPDEKEEGYLFKFEENTACVPRLRIKGKKGQKIVIQASEYCNDDNVIVYNNTQHFYPFGFCQRDIYICRGEGVEEYTPSFTYHGARYFLVMGLEDDQVSKDTLTMLVIGSDIEERGNFDCSDRIANALQRNTRISTLANFVYYPTDCPHREKNGWTGDAAVSAEHIHQNLAPEKSFKQWLKQVCASQRDNGQLPGIVPTAGWGFDWGNGPAWDEVITELPYQTYKYRGDLSLFKVVSDSVIKYLNYASKRRRADGLIAIGLGDWCHAERILGHNFLCPLEVSDTAIVYNMCCKAEIMFRAIGLNLQANFCKMFGNELREAFRAKLINYNNMTVKGNCQGAQAIGLYYGLFDNGEIPTAYAKLVSLIHEADDHFDCGMIGLRVIFRVLGAHGDAALAYKMITRTDSPSYGMWVEKFGLVSLAESFQKEYNGYNTSYNHHFLGDISGFFISHLAGIQVNPFGNSEKCVNVAPQFIPELEHAHAFYDTVCGKIDVSWKRDGEKILLTITKPDGIYGDVILPDGYQFCAPEGSDDYWMPGRFEYQLENTTYIVGRKI